jgi:serine/threonine protein kinase
MAEIQRGPGEPAAQDPIVLKNRIAVLTPDPIAEGAFGQVYVGKILNPVGLLAERIVWGEESPRWLGLDDIPFEEAGRDEAGWLPLPLTDLDQRRRVYEAGERLWKDYLDRRSQDRQKAAEEYRDLLNLIDPMLDEDRIIAVKVLRPPVADDPEVDQKIIADSVRRFIKENDMLRTLRHPGIVRRFGLVKDQKMGWCLLLEYIEGETLDAYLRRQPDGRMPFSRAVQVGREIAEALKFIHARGVIHRDLKPQNIMVRKDDGRAVIMDFGIGKWTDESNTQQLTMSGVRVGTPRYMAPEQARADGSVSPAADVYALATILFEMVTGHAAYEGIDFMTVINHLCETGRPHPSFARDWMPRISRELEAVIEVGREKDAAKRWSIDEILEKLERVQAADAYEGPSSTGPEDRTAIERALRETRLRKKEVAWEEQQLETRLHFVDLRGRIQETWALLERKSYREAQKAVEALRKEVATLPDRYGGLRNEFDNLEKAWRMASARHEAEALLALAEQHDAAQRFTDVGASLDAAAQRLGSLPKEGYGDVHDRHRRTAERYDAQHRAFVELFNALRKSFVDKIQERARELAAQLDAGRTIEASKIVELLQQADTAEKNLRTIEREKVGPGAYDAARRDLRDQRALLEDLLKRTGLPA